MELTDALKQRINNLIYVSNFGEPADREQAQTEFLDTYPKLSERAKEASGINLQELADNGATSQIKERAAIIFVQDIPARISDELWGEVENTVDPEDEPGFDVNAKADRDASDALREYMGDSAKPEKARRLAGDMLLRLLVEMGDIGAAILLSENAPFAELKSAASNAVTNAVKSAISKLETTGIGQEAISYVDDLGHGGSFKSGTGVSFHGDFQGMLKLAKDPRLTMAQKNLVGNAMIETIKLLFLDPAKCVTYHTPQDPHNHSELDYCKGENYELILKKAAGVISAICNGKVTGITEQTVENAKIAVAEIHAKTGFKQIRFRVGNDIIRVPTVQETAKELASQLFRTPPLKGPTGGARTTLRT